VILRREGRKDEPSAETLEEAAAVAAYWSKGKTARRVPVVYTLAKYVTRPRGAPPGRVAIRRERSIMVQPRLLPEEDEAVSSISSLKPKESRPDPRSIQADSTS